MHKVIEDRVELRHFVVGDLANELDPLPDRLVGQKILEFRLLEELLLYFLPLE